MPRKLGTLLAIVALAAAALQTAAARADADCTAAPSSGDWPLYGRDLSNSRAQPAEHALDATKARALTARFVFSSAGAGGNGNIQSTPTVAGGCVFVATDLGDVFALDASNGHIVWHKTFFVAQTRLGGVVTGAVAIDGPRALVAVSDAGKPFVAALDVTNGDELWRHVVDTRPGAFMNASPVPFDGMVFAGFAGDEYVPGARGGYAILDARTGDELAKHYTIPDADYDRGYFGGSIWSTAAVDEQTHTLYAGAGNPASHDKEHAYTNALLKIDVDPRSDKFGAIVDAYKGLTDQYYPGLDKQPVCEAQPDVEYGDAWSATCVQFDLDFGASPNLYRDARGALLVGDLQKSGVYHAVYADAMQRSWTALLGTPCFVCNAASPAVANGTVFAAATQPGQLVALDANAGGYDWAQPLADGVHYNSVSVANGVVYAPDFFGNFNAFDASNGVPLLKRNMALDTGASVLGTQSSGVAVSNGTVYVPAAGYVVAYS
jgi:outer membrane protein assembly factor BamB